MRVLHSLAIAFFCVAPLIEAFWPGSAIVAVLLVAAFGLWVRLDPESLETLMGEGP